MTSSMQALWLEDKILSYRPEVPINPPNPGEALIRMRIAGICATDLEMVKGYYPFTGIPGHEFVGEVVQAPGYPTWIGQRVVGEINIACHQCENCRAGMPTHCQQRRVLGIKDQHGAFAEYLLLPIENLHPVPASVPDEIAVFTEPLAAALEIQEQVHIHPGEQVLVIGAGRLGQLIAQSLVLTGCDLWVLVRHEAQRQQLNRPGIHCLSEDELKRQRWDLVVEATGSSSGFQLARQAVRPRGTIILKSTYKGELQTSFSSLVVEEIQLIGSRCGPFPPALRLLESGHVDPSILIAEKYSLAEGKVAFEQAARPGMLKVLLAP
ncbi:MAG: alcohol dehydrogenase catalytic domain-containing protein [Anaerolineales bacterium]|nr:alcohol dehydrogenase catalytic domain-containing protein [Anaerolineales bacterium]